MLPCADKHRARVIGDRVRVILIEDCGEPIL
jgi:hypothetical protein